MPLYSFILNNIEKKGSHLKETGSSIEDWINNIIVHPLKAAIEKWHKSTFYLLAGRSSHCKAERNWGYWTTLKTIHLHKMSIYLAWTYVEITRKEITNMQQIIFVSSRFRLTYTFQNCLNFYDIYSRRTKLSYSALFFFLTILPTLFYILSKEEAKLCS